MSGYTSTLPSDVLTDVGVLTREVASVATPLGASRGGLTYTPDNEIRAVEFDGKRTRRIEGLDRFVMRGGKISGTMIVVGKAQLQAYEPGATVATAGTPAVDTITPKNAGTYLSAGDYLDNLTWLLSRNAGGTVAIIFKKALCTKWELKAQDNNEAEVSVEFEAVLSAADAAVSTDKSPVVYKVTAAA